MQGVSKKVDNFEIALSTLQSNYDYQVFLSIQIIWVLLMYNERKNCEILIFKIQGGLSFSADLKSFVREI